MSESRKKLVNLRTNLLLTRPEDDSINLSKSFDKSKFNIYISPLIQIIKSNYKFNKKHSYDFIIFTSKNGILNFKHFKKDDKIIVIGDGTYLLAKKLGIRNILNVRGNSTDLKKKIKPLLRKGLSFIHPTSKDLNKDLMNFFSENGCNYKPIDCYLSKANNSYPEIFENFFHTCEYGLVTLFSKRTAYSFKNEVLKLDLSRSCKKKKILVLSKMIGEELTGMGLENILITEEPNEKSMIDLIMKISQ